MTTPEHFRVNSPAVIHETIDDEVIVANLDEGFYYSINECGVAVWNALVAGTSVQRIVDLLTQKYGDAAADVANGVGEFVTSLQQESLVVADAQPTQQEDAPASLQADKLPAAFEAPQLQKYTDMQQLLLLDPIHEVDETGWPNVVPEKADKE